jgi:predicted metalloprotease
MNINTTLTTSRFTLLPILLVTALVSIFLSGCDSNDKNSKKSFTTQQPVQKYSKDTTLKGKVRNKKGRIYAGEIKATDSKGKIVATTQLEKDYHYSIKIPTGTELPIVLTFYPDKKSANKKKLNSAVIYTSITKYDINELTTLIAKKAKALGGYTHSHMLIAADSTIDAPDANKTTTGFRGDPTKQYGGWH